MSFKSTTPAQAALVRGADAEVLASDPLSVITLLADTPQTGGHLTSNRSLLKAGSTGAPPHSHHRSAELFFVIDGALDVLVGDEITTLRTGDLLVVPPGVTHAFAPAEGHDADVLFVFTPGVERFGYYRLLDRAYAGEVGYDALAATSEQYDNHYERSPVWEAHVG